jgi:EAL domain-containing protein (putative c-di-GMP-specific phosphodiesterase class I)
MLTNLNHPSSAPDHNPLVPCFRPLVELRTGQLVGFEVLARRQHPDHGLVLPANLISLARHTGLADDLAHQVFSKPLETATYCAADSRRYVSYDAELKPAESLVLLEINTPGAAVLAC